MSSIHETKAMKIPIYKGRFIIVISSDLERVSNMTYPDLWEGDTDIYAHAVSGGGNYFLVLNPHNRTALTHGVIAHEAIHTAFSILGDRGVIVDHNNNEALTYLSEWITDQVYKFLGRICIGIH